MIFNVKKTFLNMVKVLKENLHTNSKENLHAKKRLEREDYLKMSFNDYKSMRDMPFLLPEKMKYAKFKRWPVIDAKYCSIEDLVKYIS